MVAGGKNTFLTKGGTCLVGVSILINEQKYCLVEGGGQGVWEILTIADKGGRELSQILTKWVRGGVRRMLTFLFVFSYSFIAAGYGPR